LSAAIGSDGQFLTHRPTQTWRRSDRRKTSKATARSDDVGAQRANEIVGARDDNNSKLKDETRPHDAVAQPVSRSIIGEFRTNDQMASSIPDARSDAPVVVLRMGIGLEAREEASPHPDRVGAECQRSSKGPTIGNATGSDDAIR